MTLIGKTGQAGDLGQRFLVVRQPFTGITDAARVYVFTHGFAMDTAERARQIDRMHACDRRRFGQGDMTAKIRSQELL